MVIIQRKSKRKTTGGRYKKHYASKRKFEIGRAPMLTGIGEQNQRVVRTKGSGEKIKLLSADIANVYDPKTKTHSKAKIKGVMENPANRHFIRRNIMTKGTVIDTDKGKARITSRPGQEGCINAVLI